MAMAIAHHRESSSGSITRHLDSTGKYVRYTAEQVEALERVYAECPKPSSLRRQQLIRECPILSNIEPKQIKVWFQNRRYLHKPPAPSIFLSYYFDLLRISTLHLLFIWFYVRNSSFFLQLLWSQIARLRRRLATVLKNCYSLNPWTM